MKNKILYLECYSGISGDMTVAALLDLGADQQVLLEGLNSLKVDGYQIKIGRRLKNSIDACDFDVILEQDEHSIDHQHIHQHTNDHHDHTKHHTHELDQAHSHSHEHPHPHDHSHIHAHSHMHDQASDHRHISEQSIRANVITQEHGHHHSALLKLGHHEHRNLFDINSIIEQSNITPNAKELAKKIFHIIAIAEAKAHKKPLDQVHFHEVGAIDSIVDIVATAICLDNLEINEVIVSELYEGTGQIKCQHGLLPIPVPAVSNISTEHQIRLHITNVKGELVTPTGAAIVAAIRTSDALPKEMIIHKIGLGAGKRNYENTSGILRAMLIEDASSTKSKDNTDKIWILEANIDDCSGEALAYAMELLFKQGAKDVYYTPIFMKKNRPAYLLGVICSEEKISDMERIIFTNTTTIGIRKHEAIRTILDRELISVQTPYGDAVVKVCTYQNQRFIYPEYESIKELCNVSGQDYLSMYHYVQALSLKQS
jgi:uncharacterized protein (TIGR00299 family) protein